MWRLCAAVTPPTKYTTWPNLPSGGMRRVQRRGEDRNTRRGVTSRPDWVRDAESAEQGWISGMRSAGQKPPWTWSAHNRACVTRYEGLPLWFPAYLKSRATSEPDWLINDAWTACHIAQNDRTRNFRFSRRRVRRWLSSRMLRRVSSVDTDLFRRCLLPPSSGRWVSRKRESWVRYRSRSDTAVSLKRRSVSTRLQRTAIVMNLCVHLICVCVCQLGSCGL
jgi:hypothetical protein